MKRSKKIKLHLLKRTCTSLARELECERDSYSLELKHRYSDNNELINTSSSLLESIEKIKLEKESLVSKNLEMKTVNELKELDVEKVFEKYIAINKRYENVQLENKELAKRCVLLSNKKTDHLSKRKQLNDSLLKKKQLIEENKIRKNELAQFIENIEIEINNLIERKDLLGEELRNQKEILSSKDQRRSDLKIELSKLKELDSSTRSQRDELVGDIDSIGMEISGIEKKIIESKRSVKNIQREIESQNRNIAKSRETFNEHLLEKSELQENKGILEVELDQLRIDLIERKSEINFIKEEKDSLVRCVESLNIQISTGTKELLDLNHSHDQSEDDLISFRDQKKILNEQLEDLRGMTRDLIEKSNQLNEEENSLKIEIIKLKDSKIQLESNLSLLKTELRTLESRNSSLFIEKDSVNLSILESQKILDNEAKRLSNLQMNEEKLIQKIQNKNNELKELDLAKKRIEESFKAEEKSVDELLKKKTSLEQSVTDRHVVINELDRELQKSRSVAEEVRLDSVSLEAELLKKEEFIQTNKRLISELEQKTLSLKDTQYELQKDIDGNTHTLNELNAREVQLSSKMTEAYISIDQKKVELGKQANLKVIKEKNIEKLLKKQDDLLIKIENKKEEIERTRVGNIESSKEIKRQRINLESFRIKKEALIDSSNSIETRKRLLLKKLSSVSNEILSEQDILDEESKIHLDKKTSLNELEEKCSRFEMDLVDVRLDIERKRRESKEFEEKSIQLNSKIKDLSSRIKAHEEKEGSKVVISSISQNDIDTLEKEVARLSQKLTQKNKNLKKEAQRSSAMEARAEELRLKKAKLVEHVTELDLLLKLEDKTQFNLTNFNDQLESEVIVVNKELQVKKSRVSKGLEKSKIIQKKKFKRPSFDA